MDNPKQLKRKSVLELANESMEVEGYEKSEKVKAVQVGKQVVQNQDGFQAQGAQLPRWQVSLEQKVQVDVGRG